MNNLYNEKYFEDGIKSKISGYENYSWIPTRSIPEALDIKNNFNFKTCVDYGCAKGFLVKALRLLDCEAYGEDISDYARNNAPKDIINFLSSPNDKKYDLLIAKDVLEHIDEKALPEFLKKLYNKAEQFFFVIPLGDNDKFRILEYELDITHVTKKDEEWWLKLFNNNGFKLKSFSYNFGSMKEKWINKNCYGNGFFIFTK